MNIFFEAASGRRSRIIKEIYERIPKKTERNYTDLSLAGGRTKPESVEKILEYLTPRRKNFYDLGSGQGEVVIQAGFANKGVNAVGIEIVEERYRDALEALKLARSDKFKMPSNAEIHFINDSFLNVDFSDADVVYASALAFDDEIMGKLESRFMKLKDDAIIIVVDKELSRRNFELQKEDDNFKMGYGKGHAYFYKKRVDTGAEFLNR